MSAITRKMAVAASLAAFCFIPSLAKATANEPANPSVLTVEFPGLSSVHTKVQVADGIAGSATGDAIKQSNWKRDRTTVEVPRGVYDLNIRHGSATRIVDNVDCRSGACVADGLTAKLTVKFPGLYPVHTDVRVPDNAAGTVGGDMVTRSNWKKNETSIAVLAQRYDLAIRHGAATQIVDNIDCTSGSCTVDGLTATMKVKFPGLYPVHTDVHSPDGSQGTAKGEMVTRSNWKKHETSIKVLAQSYDLAIHHGSATRIVDNVDCTSGACTVDGLTATMTVRFPGLYPVHTDVRAPDHTKGTAEGERVTRSNWKKNETSIAVLAQRYDLAIRHGSATRIVDNVDCSSGACTVDGLTATMTVKFPGLYPVHTDVRAPDNTEGTAEGERVTRSNWKKHETSIAVLAQRYDLRIRHGSATRIIDDLDCTSGTCTVDGLTAAMTVKFLGLYPVHTDVRAPDDEKGAAEGELVTRSNWKKNEANIAVLKQRYDLRIRHGSATQVVDNVDCTSGACTVDGLTAAMTVRFPGLYPVHTDVRAPDGKKDAAEGELVTRANWKKDEASIAVLKQLYDLRIRHGAAAQVVDKVDCTSGSCTVDGLTAAMTVKFPGLNSVHTDVRAPDEAEGAAEGELVTRANWKKNETTLAVLAQRYDLRIRHGAATRIVDNVDCTSGKCTVDDLTAKLRVEFPGLTNVHTDVRVPDGAKGVAEGDLVTHANWKTHEASLAVLRQKYDVRVRHGATTVFDDVDCSAENCKVVIEGNVQLTLVDGDKNIAVPGKHLKAHEKLSDATLAYVMAGLTNNEGKVNFTLPGLNAGKIYVIKAYNPLGNRKTYYSPFISQEGPMKFVVTEDGDNTLDLTPPEVSINDPLEGSNVSQNGFLVAGAATDNRQIESVELTIVSGGNITEIAASYSAARGTWNASVPQQAIMAGQAATLTATATDPARNEASATITVTPITDNQGPQIAFTSHSDGDEVPVTGFLLSGTVSDLTGVRSLSATLDPPFGLPIIDQPVEFALGSGAWTLAVQNGQIFEDTEITVTLTATDVDGNTATTEITLDAVRVDNSGLHMINRITFGVTPELIDEVGNDATGYLEQQLDPAMVDDSVFEGIISSFVPSTKEQLQRYALLHMIHSRRQLQEVMTWFWDNHFNTDINTTRNNADGEELAITPTYELEDNDEFRANALGNFGDLLEISAKSPAMLIYLDSISNVDEDSNENYAREVMELQTMGVDGGYTETDVARAAELFTGWTVQNGAFFFDQARHNFDGQFLLSENIPSGGVEQGEQLLTILAEHPSTAKYLCEKLIALFVSDTLPTGLPGRCESVFLDNVAEPDQIAKVLREILTSPEFGLEYRSKIKTPVELVVGVIRNLGADTDGTDLAGPMAAMGLRLFENPVPTGWSEIGPDWINSSLLIERMKWTNRMVRNTDSGSGTRVDPLVFFPARDVETAEGIANYLLRLTLGDDFSDLELQQALDVLNENDGFDISRPDAEERLRRLQGTVLSFPQYQFQ